MTTISIKDRGVQNLEMASLQEDRLGEKSTILMKMRINKYKYAKHYNKERQKIYT